MAGGGAPAATSVVCGLLAVGVGGIGTPLVVALTPGTVPERVQLALFCAPAVVAAGIGGTGAIAGCVAAVRSSGGAGVVGLLGAAIGAASVLAGIGWLLFVAGLVALSGFAWH